MGVAAVPPGRCRPHGRVAARVLPIAAAMLLASTGAASAQQAISTGTITGVVQDEQNLPMPGVLIDVINAETREQRSTTSNATGIFNVPASSSAAIRCE